MENLDAAEYLHEIRAASDEIRKRLPSEFTPEIGIIGGSGLSTLEQAVRPRCCEINYDEVKGFPVSTVTGHPGKLIFGFIGSSQTPAVLMNGRAHLYEGHSLHAVSFAVRTLRCLGIKTCIVTNAAGSLNSAYNIGDVVVIQDHINFPGLAGTNPLRGPNLDFFGPRFVALSDAYDLELRRIAHVAWREISSSTNSKMALHEGVYAFVGGPCYETRAECRMLSMLGADLVGMSTAPEVIVARHSGIRILGLSIVTNNAVLEPGPKGNDSSLAWANSHDLLEESKKGKADHEEVLAVGYAAAQNIQQLIVSIIDMMDASRKNNV